MKEAKRKHPGHGLWKGFCSIGQRFWLKIQFSRSVLRPKICPGYGCGCVHFSTLHCSQSIQLENDDSTDKQCQDSSIEFHTNQNFDLGHNWAKRREVRVEGIFDIWWAAARRVALIRIFLAQNYRPSDHFHDWDSRASDLTKTLGLNQSLKNTILESAILYCSGQIREFESACIICIICSCIIARNCVIRTTVRGAPLQTNSNRLKRFCTFMGRQFSKTFESYCTNMLRLRTVLSQPPPQPPPSRPTILGDLFA